MTDLLDPLSDIYALYGHYDVLVTLEMMVLRL